MTFSKYFNWSELKRAYLVWRPNYKYLDLERELLPYLEKDMKPAAFPNECLSGGWVKQTREANFLSADEVAKRCGLSRASYIRFEEREMTGSITLANLAKAAEGMNCELVYAIRPKDRVQYSYKIFRVLVKAVEEHSWITNCHQKRREFALAGLITAKMEEPKFKREQNWSQKSNRG